MHSLSSSRLIKPSRFGAAFFAGHVTFSSEESDSALIVTSIRFCHDDSRKTVGVLGHRFLASSAAYEPYCWPGTIKRASWQHDSHFLFGGRLSLVQRASARARVCPVTEQRRDNRAWRLLEPTLAAAQTTSRGHESANSELQRNTSPERVARLGDITDSRNMPVRRELESRGGS